MKKIMLPVLAGLALTVSSVDALAQVAGHTNLGVTVTELKGVYSGWSAKKSILGKTVYNDANEKVGKIDDLIIAPDSAVSFAVVGVGGFIGLGKHDVAIPVNHFKYENGRIDLPGATKETIKAMPEFEYNKVKS